MEDADVDVAISLLRHTVNARSEAVESRKREKREMEENTAENQTDDGRSQASDKTGATSAAGTKRSASTAFDPLPTAASAANDADVPATDPDTQPEEVIVNLTEEKMINLARRAVKNVIHSGNIENPFTTEKLQEELISRLDKSPGWPDGKEVPTSLVVKLLKVCLFIYLFCT